MEDKYLWCEGEYAYFRDDLGRLWKRKLDLVYFKYIPWELVENEEN